MPSCQAGDRRHRQMPAPSRAIATSPPRRRSVRTRIPGRTPRQPRSLLAMVLAKSQGMPRLAPASSAKPTTSRVSARRRSPIGERADHRRQPRRGRSPETRSTSRIEPISRQIEEAGEAGRHDRAQHLDRDETRSATRLPRRRRGRTRRAGTGTRSPPREGRRGGTFARKAQRRSGTSAVSSNADADRQGAGAQR